MIDIQVSLLARVGIALGHHLYSSEQDRKQVMPALIQLLPFAITKRSLPLL